MTGVNRCPTCGAYRADPLDTKHGKVAEDLRVRITRGYLKPGDPVPSEAALMARYRVSRVTVRTALATLQREGRIAVVRGVGRTVLGEGQ